MPKELENKLWKEANSHKNWTKEHKNAYVYKTLRNIGWKPQSNNKVKKLAEKQRRKR